MNDPTQADVDLNRVLVVIPTYNEAENVESIIARTVESVPYAHILIVDDGSPDGTGKLADAVAADDERVHVLHRASKAGLGAAYVAGFGWGIDEGFDVLVEMDADGSHAPEQLPRLLAGLTNADLVIGSRWIPGGAVVNWPRSREVLSRGANVYARVALGIDVHDATAGFRAYRRTLLQAINFQTCTSRGYCFQIDLAWRAIRRGHRVAEVPITFTERERGESKMSSDVVREAFVRVAAWAAVHRARQLRATFRRRNRARQERVSS